MAPAAGGPSSCSIASNNRCSRVVTSPRRLLRITRPSISTTGITFSYDPVAANATANATAGGTVTLACTKGSAPSIGLSLGGTTGYAINPARDLGPRLAHALLPIPGKGPSDWGYAWVPVVGPLLGGGLAALAAKAVFLPS